MPRPGLLIKWHSSDLPLSRYPKVRQRYHHTLLAPSADPQADARDPRWTTQRAMGSPAFPAPYAPGAAAEELKPWPRKITRLSLKWCPVSFYNRSLEEEKP